VKTVSDEVVRHSLANYPRKMISGSDSFYQKLWVKVTALERNRRFSIVYRFNVLMFHVQSSIELLYAINHFSFHLIHFRS